MIRIPTKISFFVIVILDPFVFWMSRFMLWFIPSLSISDYILRKMGQIKFLLYSLEYARSSAYAFSISKNVCFCIVCYHIISFLYQSLLLLFFFLDFMRWDVQWSWLTVVVWLWMKWKRSQLVSIAWPFSKFSIVLFGVKIISFTWKLFHEIGETCVVDGNSFICLLSQIT